MGTETIKTVVIDGVEYVPRDTFIPDRAMKLLSEVYGTLWAEGYYDPITEAVGKFARPLSDKMSELNDILGFKK